MKLIDVRDDLRKGREPLARILAAAHGLGEAEELVIIAPFEPRPLYQVLEARGLQHHTERTDDGGWRMTFARPSPGQ